MAIASIPSTGQISTIDVPRQTTKPNVLVSSVSFMGSSGSRKYSRVLSNTRFTSGSNPFKIPDTSRPPENLTLMAFSKYLKTNEIYYILLVCS